MDNNNDIGSNLPAISDDTLLEIARTAEARIESVIKIKQLSLKVTNASDWTNQQEKPYIQASGSEKIANLFNISVMFLTPEPLYQEDPDGHYTYVFSGRFSMGGRSIEVEGSRSSRDPFFKQNLYEKDEKGISKLTREKKIEERDNKRDVRMAAYTNMMGNGITRLLGIRNLTWEDLKLFAGIEKEQVGRVEYKTKGEKPPLTPPGKKSEAKAEGEQTEPVISEPQSKRFYAIAKGSKKTEEEIKKYLIDTFKVDSSLKLPKSKYEEACHWAMKETERNPGEDPE
jgi:hypothetical protein